MRLTASQATRIRDGVARFFGPGSRVWLFGSRLDDRSRGGDIDLYVEPVVQDPASLVDAKLHFLRAMHRQMGEQRIDVVLHRTAFQKKDLPVHRFAKENGERLL